MLRTRTLPDKEIKPCRTKV